MPSGPLTEKEIVVWVIPISLESCVRRQAGMLSAKALVLILFCLIRHVRKIYTHFMDAFQSLSAASTLLSSVKSISNIEIVSFNSSETGSHALPKYTVLLVKRVSRSTYEAPSEYEIAGNGFHRVFSRLTISYAPDYVMCTEITATITVSENTMVLDTSTTQETSQDFEFIAIT